MRLPIQICRVDTADGPKDYVSCLPGERLPSSGLPGEAILGVLLRPLQEGEPIRRDNFATNSRFVRLLHATIAKAGPQLPGLLATAERQREGMVWIVDLRTPTPEGPVPPEDLIGVFQIRNGLVIPDSYQPCPKHAVLSERGFLQLDPELQACVLAELASIQNA